MRYSKKATVATLVAATVLGGSLIAYRVVNQRTDKPAPPPVGTESTTAPHTLSPTQAFTGIQGMKVMYPAGWSATPSLTNSTNDNRQQSVVFEAPGTRTKTVSDGGEELLSGAKITLFKNNFSQLKNLDAYKQSDSFIWKYAENKKDSMVQDMQVVEFDVSYEHPYQHYAVFYKYSGEYVMAMDAKAHKNADYKLAFDNIIKTMEFTKQP